MPTKDTLSENKMGVLPVGKLLANMAIPMMISMLAQALYNVVDSIFVARVSENALSAVSLAFPLQNLMIGVGVGTSVGMNALLSRSLGAKRQEDGNRAANTAVFLGLLSAIVFALIGFFGARAFYLAQTDVEEIIEYGTSYSSICLIFSFGLFAQFVFERMLQSTGRTGLAMATQILGALTNIILDPILIFGLFGFPRLEVAGAAIATVIGQIVAAIAAILINLRKNPDIQLRLSHMRWHGPTVKEIYRIGFPSIVMQSISSIMTFGMNLILLSFTTTAAAVFGVYFKLQSFIFMPVFGLNNGMVPIISYNYGARNLDRIKKTVRLTILVAICVMSCGLLIFELFPSTLLLLFDASDTMLQIGVPALRTIAIHFPLAGFCIIAGSVCQAVGNPFHSLTTSVCRQLLVLLPVAWLLSRTGNLHLVWFAFPIAELMSLLVSSIFLRKTMRRLEQDLA